MFPPHTAHFCPSQNILKPNAKDMSRELCQDPWTLNQAASLWCLKNMNSSTAVLQNTQGGIMLQQSWGCNFPTKRRKTNKQAKSITEHYVGCQCLSPTWSAPGAGSGHSSNGQGVGCGTPSPPQTPSACLLQSTLSFFQSLGSLVRLRIRSSNFLIGWSRRTLCFAYHQNMDY